MKYLFLITLLIFSFSAYAQSLFCSKNAFGKQVVCATDHQSCISQAKRMGGGDCLKESNYVPSKQSPLESGAERKGFACQYKEDGQIRGQLCYGGNKPRKEEIVNCEKNIAEAFKLSLADVDCDSNQPKDLDGSIKAAKNIIKGPRNDIDFKTGLDALENNDEPKALEYLKKACERLKDDYVCIKYAFILFSLDKENAKKINDGICHKPYNKINDDIRDVCGEIYQQYLKPDPSSVKLDE